MLADAAHDLDFGVRVHAYRILAEKEKWTPELHKIALAGLKDDDANVRRAAAEALARHPDAANIRPLLDLRHAVAEDDPQLLFGVRIALRDQLRPDDNWAKLPTTENWTDRDVAAIADVSLGVPSAPAAAFLVKNLDKLTGDPARSRPLRPPHQPLRRGGRNALPVPVRPRSRAGQPQPSRQPVQGHRRRHRGALVRSLTPPCATGRPTSRPVCWASSNGGDIQAGVELVGSLRLEGASRQDRGPGDQPRRRPRSRSSVAALNALTSG